VGPDFQGIGARKAGTTWLDAMLRLHPDVWLPPVKELHQFDGSTMYRRVVRNRSPQKAISALLNGDPKAASWYLRFLAPFGRSDSLFPETGPFKIRGEITPAYQTLSTERVSDVAQLRPGIKLLFIMRNPVDRVLSALSMMYTKSDRFDPGTFSSQDIHAFASRPEVANRTQYIQTIETRSEAFGSER
jgi:hypothetical protein